MPIPQQYLDALNPVLELAQEHLRTQGVLVPVAFIGSMATGNMLPMTFTGSGEDEKDAWAHHISTAAAAFAADFVCIAMESWALPQKHAHLHRDILRKYGSVGASPYKLDVVSISIETPAEIWMAQCPLKPLGLSKKKKTFDLAGAQWQRFTEAAGRFTGLLPNSQIVDPTRHAD